MTDCADADIVRWRGPRTNIICDMDGTLTGTGVETYITPYKKHFDKSINESKCTNETGQGNKYDSSVVCTGTKLRRTMFRNF